MSWYRIDEQREISTDFITCAEYQLFLDDKRAQGERRQPDHWGSDQFPRGDALEPILGVRGENADRFCEWLSQRQSNRFRYRLPTQEEISDHLAVSDREIGCWCMAVGQRFVYGHNPTRWNRVFFDIFNREWNYSIMNFSDSIKHICDLLNNFDINRAIGNTCDRNIRRIFDLALSISQNTSPTYAINHISELISELAKAITRINANNQCQYRNFDSVCILDIAHKHDLSKEFNDANSRARTTSATCDLARVFDLVLAVVLENTYASNIFPYQEICYSTFILLQLLRLTEDKNSRLKSTWYKRFWSKQTEIDSTHDIGQRLDTALNLYAFFLLIDERRKGNLPAWEGIRIVRERLE